MSKKNRLKKRRAHQAIVAEGQKRDVVHIAQTAPASSAVGNYNMTSDFKGLFLILAVYTSLVVGLYYYDLQTHILNSIAEKALSML